jgi:hypothetical protein
MLDRAGLHGYQPQRPIDLGRPLGATTPDFFYELRNDAYEVRPESAESRSAVRFRCERLPPDTVNQDAGAECYGRLTTCPEAARTHGA